MSVVLDGKSLTPEGVAAVARTGGSVQLSGEGRARNEAAYVSTLGAAQRGDAIYGLSTGVGALKAAAIDPRETEEQQRRLLRSHTGGAGVPVTPELGRATLVVRANQLAAGGGGVIPALLDALVTALNEGAAPRVRTLGSVGTGDLGPLAEIGLGLLGEREVEGLKPVASATLGPRDGLFLMSSNAKAIAESSLCSADLKRLARTSNAIAALSFEAAQANPNVLDARVHQARPHPGQVAAAAELRRFLEGYQPAQPRLQDSFAFRCLPQVQGALFDAAERLYTTVSIELNAAAENAVIAGDEALANGNFHGAPLALALDAARNALAQAASLGCVRLADLLDAKVTGLTPFLALRPGPDSGLMILEYTANEALAEIRLCAQPATQTASLSSGVENHASFAALSARQTTRALEQWRVALAAELCAATRAMRMRRQSPAGKGAAQLFERACVALPEALEDRPLVEDIDKAIRFIDAVVLA
jgi:histidine ammonia-lyase